MTSSTTMLRLRIDVVEWTRCRSTEGIEQWAFDTKISKYRDITTKYRYRTFASIAILWHIEYRTSTSIRFFGGFVIACGHWWNLVGLSWRQSWGHLFICKLLQPLSKTLFYSILAKVCMILSVSTQGDRIPPSPFFVVICGTSSACHVAFFRDL